MEPRYSHDCSQCTFLGQYFGYDLYHCTQIGHPTVIARWASDGPDYYSGLIFSRPYNSPDGPQPPIEPLRVARERAEERGLLQKESI